MPAEPFAACREHVVVCDNGTGFVKCGFAGDLLPKAVFPCVVGRSDQLDAEVVTVGCECQRRRAQLRLSYPMKNGIVHNWEDMTMVWDHAFRNELQVDPRDSRILLTDPNFTATSSRERMLQVMFETFGFAAAFQQVQAVLTLYAQGLLTGLVIDSGESMTNVVPVVDGYVLSHACKRLPVAGRHITDSLMELLLRKGYCLNRCSDVDALREAKEQLCYVAADYEREMQLVRATTVCSRSYVLPDGRLLVLDAERFRAPEALFNPRLVDVEAPGLTDTVFNCIQDVDIDLRLSLYGSVVLSGGTTMLPGLATRLERGLRGLYLNRTLKGVRDNMQRLRLRVEDPPQRRHLVFSGGAVLADIMKDHHEFWISRQEYQEDPHRALKKCGAAAKY